MHRGRLRAPARRLRRDQRLHRRLEGDRRLPLRLLRPHRPRRGDPRHLRPVDRITYGELLRVFFAVAHDPTHRNRQGNDVGPQYRSAVFYAGDDEKRVAEAYIRQIDAAGVYDAPVATTLEPLGEFYEAEPYHQDYARGNPDQPYVCAVALPKVAKLDRMLASAAS